MGEITLLILEGILCQECGAFVDEQYIGSPRSCEDCNDSESDLV